MQESPLFVKTYDLLLWLLPQSQNFPRAYRFTMAERFQHTALEFQQVLINATKVNGSERRLELSQADTLLAQMRLWGRLALDLKCLSFSQYEHLSRMLAEIGRLLGAWIKSIGTG